MTPILFFVAGCGGMNLAANTNTSGIVVHAAKAVIDTNTPDQLMATSSSGAPVAVNWSIAGGQNDASIGQGSIGANGLYTPPPLLSRDTVNVEVKASFANDPATAATYQLTVTPGFVQSLTPETASLAPGGTVQVTGELAEVNSGSINWSLAANASGGGTAGPEYGSLRGRRLPPLFAKLHLLHRDLYRAILAARPQCFSIRHGIGSERRSIDNVAAHSFE